MAQTVPAGAGFRRDWMDRAQAIARTGSWRLNVNRNELTCSAETYRIFGFPAGTPLTYESFLAAVHPDDRERVDRKWKSALAGGPPCDIEYQIVAEGRSKWVRARSELEFDSGGRLLGGFGTIQDITEQRAAQLALAESEERFRGIFENAATGIAITDLEGRFQSFNPAYLAILGYTAEELRAMSFSDLVHPEDLEANMLQNRLLHAQEIPSFEILNRYVAKNGKPVWVHKHVSLLRDAARRPTHVLALVTDMTELKRHEDRICLLMREVNHRSKNMLAVIQAIARHTVATNRDDFVARFVERIQALAASQDLLVKNEWKGAELDELVRSQLAHFKDLIGARIELRGPPLMISASAAQALGMALHELATNAGKYGALSNDAGRVEIAWRLEFRETGEVSFMMAWREGGGPAVTAPSKEGFGSTVISRAVKESLNASVDLDFPANGLSWRLACAAAEVIGDNRFTSVG